MSWRACELCGGKCGPVDGWTEDDARQEAAELFTGIMDAPENERRAICDDCWRDVMAWMRETYGPPPWPHRKIEP